MFFSVQTKNLNWEILTKNLVTFKRWDGVKDEKFQFYRGSLKNLIFKEGVCEKPICMGELPKSGAWTVCRFKEGGGGWQRKGGFLRGVDTPMHSMVGKVFWVGVGGWGWVRVAGDDWWWVHYWMMPISHLFLERSSFRIPLPRPLKVPIITSECCSFSNPFSFFTCCR